MEKQPDIEKPKPTYLSGSRAGDIWIGIGLSVVTWILGIVAANYPKGGAGCGCLAALGAAYLGFLIFIENKGARSLATSLLVTTFLVPLGVVLAFFGMCMVFMK